MKKLKMKSEIKTRKQLSLKTTQEYYERGCRHFHTGEFSAAEANYTKAIRMDNKFINARIQWGKLYAKTEKFDLAIDNFAEARHLVSVTQFRHGEGSLYKAKILCHIADAQLALGKFQEAIDTADKSAFLMEEYTREKDFAASWCVQGMAWLKLGNDKNASFCFIRAAAKCTYDSYYVNSLLERSRILRKSWKTKEALEDCNDILRHEPNHPEALVERSYCRYAETFQSSDADVEDLRRAVAIRPEYAEAWTNLAYCLSNLERLEEVGEAA